MKYKQFISHIFRHFWFWPIEFWMRPLTVLDRYEENIWPEFTASLFGGGLWGALIGTLLWLINGDIHSIWIMAIVIATATSIELVLLVLAEAVVMITIVVAIVVAVVGSAVAGAVMGTLVVGAIVGMVVGLVVGAETGRRIGRRTGIRTGIIAGAYILILFVIGISLGSFFDIITISYFMLFLGFIQFFTAIIYIRTKSNWSENTWIFTWSIGLPIVGFAFFSLTPISQIPIWGILLILSFAIGIIAGFFVNPSNGLWKIKQNTNIKLKKDSQLTLLDIFYSSFLAIALGLWIASFVVSEDLGQKFIILAIFLAIAPFIGTGVLFYPLMPFITFWQYRSKQIQNFTPEKFQLTAPFRWQTFAYPLPRLRSYLFQIAKQRNAKDAFEAIQQVQLWTLQIYAAKKAAQDIACHPKTAIKFCGEIALKTNSTTILPLSTTGNIGRTIAIFVKPFVKHDESKDEEPTTLWINDYPPVASRTLTTLLAREQPTQPEWLTEFQTTQKADLTKKIQYALNQLEPCQNYQNITDLQQLLSTLLNYAQVTKLNQILTIAEQPLTIPKQFPDWMQGGWIILQNFTNELADFTKYRPLESAEARRQYLTKQQQKLQALTWENIPEYWANIGQELVEHWVNKLEQGKQQARNFLHLETELSQTSLLPGQQQLNFRIHNRSNELGENLLIEMQKTDGLHWINRQAEYPILEGKAHTDSHLDCHIDQPGNYIIRGKLTAQDLDGHLFQQQFDFQINVAEAGHIYREPPHQLYIVGECINNDQAFFGRTELLAWLNSLWRIPNGKATVVLVGQRRIGKSSLLHKIQRSESAKLLPVYIDCQGIGDKTEYSFLATVTNAMAKKLGIKPTKLSKDSPYLDFQNSLEELEILLENRRFLLMIDESEAIFHGKFGSELPNFLRSLMQQPNYPTVLLFCGTNFLKQAAWDYSSVFFNTAQFKTLSYLSKQESAELLQQTAQDFLEFSEDVLEQAYILTHGQPYLLQNLGAKIIETFSSEQRKGKERNNYVNLNDLQKITELLIKEEDNAAFREHWKNSSKATHRLLSSLAWSDKDIAVTKLDKDAIVSMMQKYQLEIPNKQIFDILQNLRGEEILQKTGKVYHFVVPLYQKWIACWYEPDLIREEGLED
ncbi:hypothetical protein QUF74_09280 [Candidatus Halobeggiatoa sp. HSG11]|nr:hypothetical protein [Candidatus Halobeggiatoa sp. HSG11]